MARPERATPRAARWAPLVFTLAFVAVLLIRAGTSPADLIRYAAYACLTVILPGTLVYRALRRRPHTFVEDLAMGAAVGLTLELAAWAAFSVLDIRNWLWLWPALVAVPFALVPRLRRHWRVRDYTPVPVGWSWAVAGVVCFFTAYLAMVFIDRNPILPPSEGTLQYLDLAYQLSLAGEAKHHFPVELPQVAGEPLYYHWFAYGHMAMGSLVGHIDLPVVALRLAIPALCAAAVVLTAVVGWRVSGRPYVGAVAAALFFAVGEFNFTHPVTMPFGTQATFVIWHGMSMIYGWVLLLALIAPLAAIVSRDGGRSEVPNDRVPALGAGAFVLAGLLMLGSSGAKGSSLPVVGVALAITAVVLVVSRRRIPWGVVALGLMTAAIQLLSTAVLYRFQTYGVELGPLQGLKPYWAGVGGAAEPWVVVAAVWIAFGLNMLLRMAGLLPMVWLKRGRLEPVQWLFLAGVAAGTGLYLLLSQPGSGNQYFVRTGFAFGVIGSAWGYAMVFERARLSRRARFALGIGTAAFCAVLISAQLRYATLPPTGDSYSPLVPLLAWAALLGLVGLAAGLLWRLVGRRRPAFGGRGAVVALTAVLVAGAPGLVMDEYKSIQAPNGGAYPKISLPKSRVDAARWVRDHSSPQDVVATNVHCIGYLGELCDSRSFWLSAYAERSVLVEGWGFAPRQATIGLTAFWDPARLALNDAVFTAPTEQNVRELRERYGVRWLVVDRAVGEEAPTLDALAARRYDDGRLAVYELN